MDGWIAQVKGAGLDAALAWAGCARRGRGWGPCPACGADIRGHDARPALGVSARGGWRCYACQAEGDAADVVAYRTCGQRLAACTGDQRALVRDAAVQAGLCHPDPGAAARSIPRRMTTARPGASVAPRNVRGIDRGLGTPPPPAPPQDDAGGSGDRPSGRPPPWDDALCPDAAERLWDHPDAEPVRRYLLGGVGEGPGGSDGRRLPEEVLRRYRVGAMHNEGWWWAVLPILDGKTGVPVNAKLCRVPDDTGARPKPKYTSCAGRPLTLFGAKSLTNDTAAPVVVVEGELDVLAMDAYGYTGSVVSGTSGATAFDDAWLDVLERYESFVLAYDVEASGVGDDGAKDLADKLGKYRCARVELPHKDASDCWLHGVTPDEIERAIAAAKPYEGMITQRVDAWADDIEAAIRDPARLQGRPTGSAKLDALFAGWGDGVYVVTGGTKVGKSSWLDWAFREQARMGVPVLCTSFENGPDALIQKLLRMQLRGDFLEHTEADRRAAMADLGRMPLHVVRQRGIVRLEDLVATIRYHRRRHSVELVLVDHLGFLVDLSRRDMDETRQLQHAMRTLTILANDERMGIAVVAHPDKQPEKEGRRPRIFDIRGTSAIQQDCSAGLSLEWDQRVVDANGRMAPNVRVHVDALRKEWGAGTGSSDVLFFDPLSLLYADEARQLPGGHLIQP